MKLVQPQVSVRPLVQLMRAGASSTPSRLRTSYFKRSQNITHAQNYFFSSPYSLSVRQFHSTGPTSFETADEAEGKATAVRPKLRIRDILKTIEERNFSVPSSASVSDAVAHLVAEKLASSLVVSSEGAVLGIFTARDLLKFIRDSNGASNNARGLSEQMRLTKITEVMTKREKLVHCSPDDTVKRCREIMFQCKIRNMPVIDKGVVKGILTMKILADSAFNLLDTGGKKGFIHNVTGRRGVPDSVKAPLKHSSSEFSVDNAGPAVSIDAELGACALPHPFKRRDGVAMNRRHYGADELSTDLSLLEDAFFAIRISDKDSSTLLPLAASAESSQVYLCVADGVGSWRQYNVNPRNYSHTLVDNAKKVILADFQHRSLISNSPFQSDLGPIHPLDVIVDAWHLTTSSEVVGSSTICVATLDKKLSQLSYCNLGDCGLMVVRHIDSETAGYMRERQKPRHLRKTDLRIAYLSQQQLRSFNLPYQLGFSNIPDIANTSFESPSDADTASIPVMPGDVIVLATDGLFDNVDLDDIVSEISDWEEKFFSGDESIYVKSSRGNEAVQGLAERLVNLAREVSLDPNNDSPFAILAKENDIMWGGGMPDDTSVIVARIVSTS